MKLKIGGIRLYYAKTENENWINSRPNPIALFIKYLEETNQIKSYRDDKYNSYIMLSDFLKYKGYCIPDTYYGLGWNEGRFKYYTEVTIDNMVTDFLVCDDTRTSLRNALFLGGPSIYYDKINKFNGLPFKKFLEALEKETAFECDLSESGIHEWFTPAKNPKVVDTIGSVDWNFFISSQEDGVMYIQDGEVFGHASFNGREAVFKAAWKNIAELLTYLNVRKFQFVSNKGYSVCGNGFRTIADGKHIFHEYDNKYTLGFVSEGSFNNGLYEFFDKRGKRNIEVNFRMCKECGQLFHMDKEEMEFFTKKNLCVPVRCSLCRKGIKQPNWEEKFRHEREEYERIQKLYVNRSKA